MSRLICLVAILMCSAAPARAALLVSYSFSGNLNATVSNGNVISQVAQTVSFGAPTSDIQTSTSGATATFYIGSSSAGYTTISDVRFEIVKANATARAASFKLYFFNDWTGGAYMGEAQTSVGFGTLPTSPIVIPASAISGLGVTLAPNQKVRAVLQILTSSSPAGDAPAVVAVDNFVFNGAAVPEPTSLAVFGVLGLGALIRRVSRRSL
jgi:hypothetical protein